MTPLPLQENEFLADTLRTSQHNFLKVAKDRSFLLDRLLQYEQPESSSESNDDSDSSDDEVPMTKKYVHLILSLLLNTPKQIQST